MNCQCELPLCTNSSALMEISAVNYILVDIWKTVNLFNYQCLVSFSPKTPAWGRKVYSVPNY